MLFIMPARRGRRDHERRHHEGRTAAGAGGFRSRYTNVADVSTMNMIVRTSSTSASKPASKTQQTGDRRGAHLAFVQASETNGIRFGKASGRKKKVCAMSSSALIDRVRGEFLEMPGLQLTMPQAARLWGLDLAACNRVVDALVESSFLRWTTAGTVVRITK